MRDIFELFKQIGSEQLTGTRGIEAIVAGLGNPGKKYADLPKEN